MRKKFFLRELMLPAFWVVIFMVSGQHYDNSNMLQGTSMVENQSTSYPKKMSNYTKSQARYLWFYILPDISGSRIYKQGI